MNNDTAAYVRDNGGVSCSVVSRYVDTITIPPAILCHVIQVLVCRSKGNALSRTV